MIDMLEGFKCLHIFTNFDKSLSSVYVQAFVHIAQPIIYLKKRCDIVE